MPQPLKRLLKLTLSLEAAAESKDWTGFNALLAEREIELAKLRPGTYAEADELIKLDARIQATVACRMEHLRTRMQATVHVNRTARAFQSAQEKRIRVDLAG